MPEAPEPKRLGETDDARIDELIVLEQAADRNYRWVCDLIEPWLGHSILEVGSGVAVVPIARRLDFLSRFAGLALLACAEKPRRSEAARA